MSDAIRKEVETILASAGVEFKATYIGETKRDEWACDAWSCTFFKEEGDVHVVFKFYTGLGNRKSPEWKYGVSGYDNGPPPRPGTLLHEQWMKQAKPQAPHPADVLQSVILDSSALGQSFESWCNEYGYDSDSRKAEGIYRACQQNADKLARVFDTEQRQALETALQEY